MDLSLYIFLSIIGMYRTTIINSKYHYIFTKSITVWQWRSSTCRKPNTISIKSIIIRNSILGNLKTLNKGFPKCKTNVLIIWPYIYFINNAQVLQHTNKQYTNSTRILVPLKSILRPTLSSNTAGLILSFEKPSNFHTVFF